jgi:hypothetical protein
MKYEIRNQNNETISTHKTYENAAKRRQRNLGWRCGICGSTKAGWGKCIHGNQNRVCDANHYNDRIIEIAPDGSESRCSG